MKDWSNLIADENKILNKHYTPGRAGHAIRYVVVHHNAANLSIQGCWNTWQTREASAHYQVDVNGRIGQLVHDKDTAWHAGNWAANLESIGIEHADINTSPWRISDKTLDNGAHLVAAVCRFYKLGRPQWGVNVFPHSHFQATACPASIYGVQKDAYIKAAQKWYDRMGGTKTPAAAKPVAAKRHTVKVDGYWGADTTLLAQEVLGTEPDGEVWHQWQDGRKKGCTTGWQYDKTQKGSPVIKALQTRLKAQGFYKGKIDGLLGRDSIIGMELKYGYKPDGVLDAPSPTIKAFQAALNKGRF